jgi:hypothetical protein
MLANACALPTLSRGTGSRGDYRRQGRNPACDEPASLLACSWLSPLRSGYRRHFTRLASPEGAAGLDPPTPKGGGPNAARRLLQCKQSASTTNGSIDPHVAEHPRARACAPCPPHELSLARTGASTRPPACARNPVSSPRDTRGVSGIEASTSWSRLLPPEGRLRLTPGRGWHHVTLSSSIVRDLATPSAALEESAASANRGFTGQGPIAFAVGTSRRGRPKACARRSFTPTRSARTPPVVRSLRRRHEETSSHRRLRWGRPPYPRPAGGRLRPRERSHRGPHHPCFREETRDPPHPRCLPSMSRLPEAAPPKRRRS